MEFDWESFFYNNRKKYKHIDAPINAYRLPNGTISSAAKNIIEYITNANKIAQHPFLPFIGYDIEERRVSKIDKTTPRDQQQSIVKKRPIRYAAHFDSMIFSYYATILYDLYEKKLSKLGLGDVVLAYRKSKHMQKVANNITFAREVFDIIKSRKNNCLALAFDIKSFYDYIDHKNLKKQWAALLSRDDACDTLPPDHFNIYKTLTKYSFIDIDIIKMYLQCMHCIPTAKTCLNCPLRRGYKLPQKLFNNMSDFHKFRQWYKEHQKICNKEKINNHTFDVNPGVQGTDAPYGIPQGSPLSALLANIYMLPFDKSMNEFCNNHGAVYRRYSDDILIICDKDSKEDICRHIMTTIKEQGKYLSIHQIEDNKKSKSKCYDFTSDRIIEEPLQYLGFTFDGKDIKIRGSSMARYLRKSKRGIRSMRLATQNKIKRLVEAGQAPKQIKTKLYRRSLYRNYTHLGKRTFWVYVNRAFDDMGDITLKKQMRKHFERVKKIIDSEDVELNKFITTLINKPIN